MVRIWSQHWPPMASVLEAPLNSVKENSVYGLKKEGV